MRAWATRATTPRKIPSPERRSARPVGPVSIRPATRWGGWALLVIALTMALLSLSVRPARAAGDGVSFLRRDYDLHIQRSGDVTVAEHWQVQFTGGPYSSATVGVFLSHAEGVDFQPVTGADTNSERVARVSDSQGHAVMQIAWTFPDAQDTMRTFTINYTLHGAIGQNATQAWLDRHFFDGPGRGGFPVGATKVTVTLPAAAAGNTQVKASYPNAQLQTSRPDDASAVVEGQNLNSGNLLEVEAVFPRSLIDANVKRPTWQQGDTPPAPPTALEVTPASGSTPNGEGENPLAGIFENAGLVLVLGLAVLAILVFIAWRLAHRLAANIREFGELGAGQAGEAPPSTGSAEGATPRMTSPPAIDLDFGQVDWPGRHEKPDLESLGLHPLEEEPRPDGVQSRESMPEGTGGTKGSNSDEGPRGTGAISGVGSGDGE